MAVRGYFYKDFTLCLTARPPYRWNRSLRPIKRKEKRGKSGRQSDRRFQRLWLILFSPFFYYLFFYILWLNRNEPAGRRRDFFYYFLYIFSERRRLHRDQAYFYMWFIGLEAWSRDRKSRWIPGVKKSPYKYRNPPLFLCFAVKADFLFFVFTVEGLDGFTERSGTAFLCIFFYSFMPLRSATWGPWFLLVLYVILWGLTFMADEISFLRVFSLLFSLETRSHRGPVPFLLYFLSYSCRTGPFVRHSGPISLINKIWQK